MTSIAFNTGNESKWAIASQVFGDQGVKLERARLETPEVQGSSCAEVASYSARWAADTLGKIVAVSDAGYAIPALGGFPGPFIKYMNQWLTADDLARLMERYDDRRVVIEEVVAICAPGKEPHLFRSATRGTLARKPRGEGRSIDQLVILDGFSDVQALTPEADMVKHWSKHLAHYQEAARYVVKHPMEFVAH